MVLVTLGEACRLFYSGVIAGTPGSALHCPLMHWGDRLPGGGGKGHGVTGSQGPMGHRGTPGLLRAVRGSSRRCQPHGLLSQVPFPRVWEGDPKARSADPGSKPLFPAVAALARPVPPSPEPSL